MRTRSTPLAPRADEPPRLGNANSLLREFLETGSREHGCPRPRGKFTGRFFMLPDSFHQQRGRVLGKVIGQKRQRLPLGARQVGAHPHGCAA